MNPESQPRNSQPVLQSTQPTEEHKGHESAEEVRRELREAIQGSEEVLATATTVFTLFPDTIVLDRTKLTITKRYFFKAAEVMSMRVEDLLNVSAHVDAFFGTIQIKGRAPGEGAQYTTGKYWRRDAVRFKRITQGYIIAMHREIDCTSISATELSGMLDRLGEDNHVIAPSAGG